MFKRFLVELTDRETAHRIVERLHHRSGPLGATVRQIIPVIAKLMKLAGLEFWAIPSPKHETTGGCAPEAAISVRLAECARDFRCGKSLARGLIISRRGEKEGSHRLGRPKERLFRSFNHESGGCRIEVEFQVHRGLESFSVGRSIESVQ
jgi:hypothetical protein